LSCEKLINNIKARKFSIIETIAKHRTTKTKLWKTIESQIILFKESYFLLLKRLQESKTLKMKATETQITLF